MFPESAYDDETSARVERMASSALRGMAADPVMRRRFELSPELRNVLAVPASRYILGSSIADIAPKLLTLSQRGYRLGIEYVGEEITDPMKISQVVDEYMEFLSNSVGAPYSHEMQIGFDLSNVGLLSDRSTAVENTRLIARAAESQNVSLMISMERSSYTDAILSIFAELAPACPNLGMTIQAQLNRSESDVEQLIAFGNKIRLVKGVYKESPEVALGRGTQLDDRYVRIATRLAASNALFAVATHDAKILERLQQEGILRAADEVEMLHGCNPKQLKIMRLAGYSCRISAVYGDEFFLHFLHRLAEHTPNVIEAVADCGDPSRILFGEGY